MSALPGERLRLSAVRALSWGAAMEGCANTTSIDRRLIGDRAAVARKLGLTRARITQLLDLLMLAPDLKDAVLALEAVDVAESLTERTLRAVAHAGTWAA